MTTVQINKEVALWLTQQLQRMGVVTHALHTVAADADQRVYYRIRHAGGSLILMHFLADPRRVHQVVQTTAFFARAGVRVPVLLGHDDQLGLVLQEDLGERLLWQEWHATQKGAMPFYEKAVQLIGTLQPLDGTQFGAMDTKWLVAEMHLFTEWLLEWLGKPWVNEKRHLEKYYLYLAQTVRAAPQCCVHRDFHSRNLCILADDTLGVLDYQGVMEGHFCYDLVSLLRDAYTDLPRAQVQRLFDLFCVTTMPRLAMQDKDEVIRQFNLIGLQRAIKVCGQFVRLWLRDDKPQYQRSLPVVARTIDQSLMGPLPDKKQHAFFTAFWRQTIKPKLMAKLP